MAIKEVTAAKLGKAKTGWTWDRKREIFFTFQVDTQFNGERYIRRGFRSVKDAEEHIEKLKMQERLHEIGFAEPLKFPTVKSMFDKYLATIAVKRDQNCYKRFYDSISATSRPVFIAAFSDGYAT